MTTIDPNLLTSIGGIVALTVALVQGLKAALADLAPFNRVPTAVYGLAVACGLTFVAHDVLGWLEGDRAELLILAVLQTLAAFGLVSAPAWKKPIGDSHLAQDIRDRRRRNGRSYPRALVVALAVTAGLSVGCATTGKLLMEADRAAYTAWRMAQDNADRVCDAIPSMTPECVRFNDRLVPIIESYQAFNRAVATNSAAEVPALVRALTDLSRAVEDLFNDPELRASVQARIDEARAIARRIRGGE